MSDTTLVNAGPNDTLPPAQLVRVTFTDRYDIELDSQFVNGFGAIYANLSRGFHFFAKSPNTATPNSNVAVIDVETYTTITVAAMLTELDGLCGFFYRVSRFEVLTPDQSDAVSTPDGSAQRNDVADGQQKQNDTDSIWGKIAGEIGATVTVVKWLALAIVIVALLLVANNARTAASVLVGKAK